MQEGGDVVARTRRPSRWLWLNVVVQGCLVVLSGWRVATEGAEGFLVAMLAIWATAFALSLLSVLADLRASLVLGEDELRVERRLGLGPHRVPRRDVLAVDGDVHGRPAWSGSVAVTVRGRERPLRLGNFDVPVRDLVPLLQEWAGVGDTPAEMTPRP